MEKIQKEKNEQQKVILESQQQVSHNKKAVEKLHNKILKLKTKNTEMKKKLRDTESKAKNEGVKVKCLEVEKKYMLEKIQLLENLTKTK